MYTAVRNLLVLALFGAATGCAGGTCADYADNIFGNPPGCECLNSVYGCGPFDYPTGYGYAESSAPRARAVAYAKAASSRGVTISLSQVRSTCPGLLKQVSTNFTVSSERGGKRIRSAKLGTVLVTAKRGRLQGKLKKAVPLLQDCALNLNLQFSGLPTKRSPATGTVNGAVTCAKTSFSCEFVYSAALTVR